MHRGFAFASQGAIECIVRFRIDSHTIKRGALSVYGYLVSLGDDILCVCIRPCDMVRCKRKYV